MAAITVDTPREEAIGFIEIGLPVKAGEKIPAGAITCVDSSGRALNGATTAGLKCAGVAREGFDNTDGADGVLTAFAEARIIRVQRGKAFLFAVAGSPAIGKAVYLVNNNDLTTVVGNVFVGWITQHDGQGGTGWYVYVPGFAVGGLAGAAVGALTDNTAGAAANTTLEAIPSPADTPASADALRDDLVANALPAIRNNFADLAAAINALRGA
jgi:hypothetical protein